MDCAERAKEHRGVKPDGAYVSLNVEQLLLAELRASRETLAWFLEYVLPMEHAARSVLAVFEVEEGSDVRVVDGTPVVRLRLLHHASTARLGVVIASLFGHEFSRGVRSAIEREARRLQEEGCDEAIAMTLSPSRHRCAHHSERLDVRASYESLAGYLADRPEQSQARVTELRGALRAALKEFESKDTARRVPTHDTFMSGYLALARLHAPWLFDPVRTAAPARWVDVPPRMVFAKWTYASTLGRVCLAHEIHASRVTLEMEKLVGDARRMHDRMRETLTADTSSEWGEGRVVLSLHVPRVDVRASVAEHEYDIRHALSSARRLATWHDLHRRRFAEWLGTRGGASAEEVGGAYPVSPT